MPVLNDIAAMLPPVFFAMIFPKSAFAGLSAVKIKFLEICFYPFDVSMVLFYNVIEILDSPDLYILSC